MIKTWAIIGMGCSAALNVAHANCDTKFKKAVEMLGALNGKTYTNISKPEAAESTRYSTTFEGTAIDATEENRFVFSVEMEKDCTVLKVQSLGET